MPCPHLRINVNTVSSESPFRRTSICSSIGRQSRLRKAIRSPPLFRVYEKHCDFLDWTCATVNSIQLPPVLRVLSALLIRENSQQTLRTAQLRLAIGRSKAIAAMFAGLTLAMVIGVPLGSFRLGRNQRQCLGQQRADRPHTLGRCCDGYRCTGAAGLAGVA